jgi:beta-mannanase
MSNSAKPPFSGAMIAMFSHAGLDISQHLNEHDIKEFEKMIGRKAASVLWYNNWEDPFPINDCEIARHCEVTPHLTWELSWPSKKIIDEEQSQLKYSGMDEVLSGQHDAYIRKYAMMAKDWGGEILIRFLHEFNGDWYSWSGFKNGAELGGPEKVKRVWKYVVNQFREAGANNVKWVWCPHGKAIDKPDEPWNALVNYWPGNEYVDWMGMDGYNWFPKDPSGNLRPYQDFDNCFREIYVELLNLAKKPIMIGEMSSGEFKLGKLNKAAWITETFKKIKSEYPWIKMFTWFNIKKELDWRANSSPQALEAFRLAVKDKYFLSKYHSSV